MHSHSNAWKHPRIVGKLYNSRYSQQIQRDHFLCRVQWSNRLSFRNKFNGISFAVSLEQQPLLIDEDGHTLREFDCHSALSYFTNELILVTNDEGTSLINRLGTDIIEPERKLFIDSERGCNVYEQLIIVKDQQECWGYADLSGNVVCPCIWD